MTELSSTTTQTTTTTTTTAERAKAIVNVDIVDKDTGKNISGIGYQITGYGEWGAHFGTENYVSSDKTGVIDVNWHDLSVEAFKAAQYWELNLRDIPAGYKMPSQTNIKFSIVNGTADVKVELSTINTKIVYGDANNDGNVTVADAVAILQHIGNKDKYPFDATQKANADCYNPGDGITGTDALTILKIDAGIIKESDLPITVEVMID